MKKILQGVEWIWLLNELVGRDWREDGAEIIDQIVIFASQI
jgi:hypothetical protein